MDEKAFKILFKEMNIKYLTHFSLLKGNKIKIKYRSNNLPVNIECEDVLKVEDLKGLEV
jgi:hypothetical protein